MARLASEQKLGFYPTPHKEMELILKRVKVESGEEVTILDPCAGEGDALAMAQRHLESMGGIVTSYGVEIEESRAKEAKKKIDHLLHCGYEEMVSSKEAISFMYLNPPFQEVNGERSERTFLRDLTYDRLSPNGLFIFNLPQPELYDCSDLLARRFDNLKVYRFTDENYDNYKQVIVYGRRRRNVMTKADIENLSTRQKEREKMKKYLMEVSSQSKEALPPLDVEDGIVYHVYAPYSPMKNFYSSRITVDDVLESLKEESDINDKIWKKMQDIVAHENGTSITPAMSLKTAHIATAIASGALPESMGDHLLVGVTKRTSQEKEQINEKSGKKERVVTARPKSLIRVFHDTGIYDLK